MRQGGSKQWRRLLPGFSRYEISEDGQLRRRFKLKTRAAGSLLKGHIDRDGYLRYTLIDDEGINHAMIGAHQLVIRAFVGAQPSSAKFQVQHKDDNKANNHYSNLRWGTPKQNSKDAVKNGAKWVRKFEDNKCSKLNWAAVADIRARYVRGVVTLKMLANDHNVGLNIVSLVIQNKVWVQ